MKIIITLLLSMLTLSLFAQDKLVGTWQLTTYIDSALTHKELHKFSDNPASYCYQITIAQGSSEIDLTGYHEGGPIPIIEQKDSWMKVGYAQEQFFIIEILDDQSLKFEEGKLASATNIFIDSTIHIFKRSAPVTDLRTTFNQIITGKYELKRSEVVFHPDGQLTGLSDFSRYELTINFWDHPPRGFDSILLIRTDGTTEYRKWEIHGEMLQLTELIQMVNEESGMYEYEVGTTSLELTRK